MSIEHPDTQPPIPIPEGNFHTDLEVYRAALEDVSRILKPSIDDARAQLHASEAYGVIAADYDAAKHDYTLLTDFAKQVLPPGEKAYVRGFYHGGLIHTSSPFIAKVALSSMLYGSPDRISYKPPYPYFVVGSHASGKRTSLLLTTPWIDEPSGSRSHHLLTGICRTEQFEEWQGYSNEMLINDLSEKTLRDMLDFDTGTYTPSEARGVVIRTNFWRLHPRKTRESLINNGLHFKGELTKVTKNDLPFIDTQKHEVIKHLTSLAIDFGKTDELSSLLKARAEADQ